MPAVTASVCATLLFFGIFVFVSADQKIITAESGQNVNLTCRAPNTNICVKWSRADLEPEYVLLYRDDQFVPDDQHPSFKNRVDLQDRQMKDGDASLILNDVTADDNGTYECRVFMREIRSWKPTSVIYLSVVPPEFLPEPNVIDSSLKSSTSPTTGIQLLLSNWSTQQLRPDTFTVNTLVYILFVLLMKETSEDLKCECVSAPHWLFLSDGNMNSCG